MLKFSFLLIVTLIPAAFNQLITFKDGKIGVNFAGYHAEAGLGGLLTGNAAHGGLSASAGTPFGQRAGAGLGGSVNEGQTRGGAYAGASAGYGVGASAALGGNVDDFGGAGGLGSEAHARGLSTKTVKLSKTPQSPQQATYGGEQGVIPLGIDQRSSFANEQQPVSKRYYKRKYRQRLNGGKAKEIQVERRFNAPSSAPQNGFDYTKFFDFGFFSNAAANFAGAPHPSSQNVNKENSYIFDIQKQVDPNTILLQKTIVPRVKPAAVPEVRVNQRVNEDKDDFDRSFESSEEEVVEVEKKKTRKTKAASDASSSTTFTATKKFQPNPNFFNDIFNIPISTLGAVSQFLSNGAANSGIAVSKTKTVEVAH